MFVCMTSKPKSNAVFNLFLFLTRIDLKQYERK
jgi:hypothetical protein